KLDPAKLTNLLTMAGVNAASCKKIGGDYIFEFEITANRPDCLSIIGIAREIAALLGKKLKVPKEIKGTAPFFKMLKEKKGAVPFIEIKDPELCPHYTARVIKNVEVKSSPDWLKERIISVGLRPVNNIVDITNFVLFETGQPMHAFDLDKLRGSLSVRRAKEGEQIITIDNIPRTLAEGTLVIADEGGPVAIAGVMGALKAEVGRLTKNILLESAFFNPVSVRRASRALGLTSESSYRFERRIDNDMVLRASGRASALIGAIAGGEIKTLTDLGRKNGYSKAIKFDPEKTSSILGISIKKNRAVKILKSLGFSVKDKKGFVAVTVPSFREDVKSEIDLTEEVARIHGYENIPLTLPHIVGNTKIKGFADILEEKIRRTLTRLGLDEIITYGLIKKSGINGLDVDDAEVIAIKNPLSIDQEIMRPTMLPGMLKVISYNLSRKVKRLSLFEVGKIYKEKGGRYAEEPVLSACLSGIRRENWKAGKQEFDFFDIKGIFECLFSELAINGASFKKSEREGFEKNTSSCI
ncbi:MAG: phenylalanine--tRNA ligase subunit beta, partial [Candidatus Omnitrophota bacterium]